MAFQFSKHYTLDQARALLPEVREWLRGLDELQQRLRELDERLTSLMTGGADIGGEAVHQLVTTLADCKDLLQQFRRRQIQIKDLERGLLDFPSMREGREVFLCWEKDEEDIQFWHDLKSGYAGREPI
jgi:hypothetical protein